MTETILHPSYVLLGGAAPYLRDNTSVLVAGGRIAAVDAPDVLRQQAPAAREIELAAHVLMPGLVNAHQHGRGITALQLGFEDDRLEPWMAGKRRRQQIDPYLQTLYAALQMIANGVTSAIHANTASGGFNYLDEIEMALSAYAESGLRVMFGIGAMDRAEFVYPATQQEAVLASLPGNLRTALGDVTEPVYCRGPSETLELMARLRSRFAGHPRIEFAYAPAGPQWVSDGFLAAMADDAKAYNMPIHMHALESTAQIDAVKECCPDGLLRHLDRLGALGPLTSLAHAVWLTADDVEIAARTGVTLVRNPGSNLRLHAGIAPLASYVAAGVNVGLGTDNTTLNDDEDLFTEARLARALTRSPDWEGVPALGAAQLLAMMTVNGARAMGQQGRTGEIAPGFAADLVALDMRRILTPYLDPDLDLLAGLVGRARGGDVRLTMIGGDIVYRDGCFTNHDLNELIARCRHAGMQSKAAQVSLTTAEASALGDYLRAHYREQRARSKSASGSLRPLAREAGWG